MARSDAILDRLLDLHPRVIDLSLDRIERLLEALGRPDLALPPVVHVAGTNGKGSVIAFLREILERSGYRVHTYTSPHLVKFHERIRLAGDGGSELISEPDLVSALEECEQANGGHPITFFEITTAAAFLVFSRTPADFLLLEVGLGGRLDATNVIEKPALCIITPLGMDHQHFLGDQLDKVAAEKAGILKSFVPCVVGPQPDDARAIIETHADRLGAPLFIAGQDWQAYEQHGRFIYQDHSGLLDLPRPRLTGQFQIENAGIAVAAIRSLAPEEVSEQTIEQGLLHARWPGRMQQLPPGTLYDHAPDGAEIWLDGGHNHAGARAVAQSLADIEERVPRPLMLVLGMLNSKDPDQFLLPFRGLAQKVVTLRIPGEENALPAEELKKSAEAAGFDAEAAPSLAAALQLCHTSDGTPPRILICGSLYLAGHVLAEH